MQICSFCLLQCFRLEVLFAFLLYVFLNNLLEVNIFVKENFREIVLLI